MVCPYCGSRAIHPWQHQLRHPLWKEMIAIDLYRCKSCQSLTSVPMPSEELLTFCYEKYSHFGYPADKHEAKKDSTQDVWYDHVIKKFWNGGTGEHIADIGAGEGFLAKKLVEHASIKPSKVSCLEHHPAPDLVKEILAEGKLEWFQKNLAEDWQMKSVFDRVFCIAVLEHVLHPKNFMRQLINTLKPGGLAHVAVPTVDSICFKTLGRRWPYIIPGEHLTIPSKQGILHLLKDEPAEILELKNMPITYSTAYAAKVLFGVEVPAFLDLALKLPVGILAFTLRRRPSC